MRATKLRGCAVGAALLSGCLLSATLAQVPAQFTKLSQDGTPIPDVNKVNPANPGDSSCWLASAANILAAAGYGAGGPAQVRAQNIYNQLTAAYGISSPGGAPDQAMSYWLANFGKNPNSSLYQPSLSYTDITAEYRTLGQVDYNFLKSELYRCQYVGVQFDNPPHAMTLVGWNDNLNQSIWHDSDRTIGLNGDDPYINAFTAAPLDWDLVNPGLGTTYLDHANGYVTLCPGLNKTSALVANYDVAWAPSPAGPAAREAGLMVGTFDPVPGWQAPWVDPNNQNATYNPFRLDNVLDSSKQKHIELLVDFYGRNVSYQNEDIRLRYFDAFGVEVVAPPTSKQLSPDNGQVLFAWVLDCQPAWEEILFPSALDYQILEGTVASWDVALRCVPEPSTIGILFLAGMVLTCRRARL